MKCGSRFSVKAIRKYPLLNLLTVLLALFFCTTLIGVGPELAEAADTSGNSRVSADLSPRRGGFRVSSINRPSVVDKSKLKQVGKTQSPGGKKIAVQSVGKRIPAKKRLTTVRNRPAKRVKPTSSSVASVSTRSRAVEQAGAVSKLGAVLPAPANELPSARVELEAGGEERDDYLVKQDFSAANAASAADVSSVPMGASGLSRPALADLAGRRMLEGERGLYVEGPNGERRYLTLNTMLQGLAEDVLRKYRVPWGSAVMLDPRTGEVLALADHSEREGGNPPISLRATFPAASLFKLVTAAAAIEHASLSPQQVIRYRGSDYVLGSRNYLPNDRLDRRQITFEDALGKSCNPAFARVALVNRLTKFVFDDYARRFAFNTPIPFDLPVQSSSFSVDGDLYDIARTAAGFGDAYISPLHAALVTGAIANKGRMMQPYLLKEIVDRTGKVSHTGSAVLFREVIRPSTAAQVLRMMQSSIDTGTARKSFKWLKQPHLRGIEVAGKTGTLTGHSPKGRYYWFVGAAPITNPEIVVAAVVIDPGGARIKGAGIGSQLLERYFSARRSRN